MLPCALRTRRPLPTILPLLCLCIVSNSPGRAEVPADSLRRTPIVDAVQRAIPAVVNIHGQKLVDANGAPGSGRRVNGMGTGIVIDERGYILTNYHVIEGVRPIQVTLHDEQTMTATMVARDPQTDLAIIKITPNQPLPLLRIGTSQDILPGEPVIAIGNAYGYHHTVTRGIVSALNRTVEVTDSQRYLDLIQTDASINPGNSGGPLLNIDGEMIGINVAVRVGADGIAFAIPVDRAMEVAANMLAAEQTSGTWHGVQGRSVQQGGQWKYVVEHVTQRSPAAQCGLRPGDRIVRIGSTRIERQLDVERAFIGVAAGTQASFEVVRSEREIPIQLVVAQLPDTKTAGNTSRAAWSRLGLQLSAVSPTETAELSGQYNGGLRIHEIRPGSPASSIGLRPGDILVGMLEWETASLGDLDYILNQLDSSPAQSIPFYVVRDRETRMGQLNLTRR